MSLLSPMPAVEWVPLEGLVQTWATFAHGTNCDQGFVLVRTAFTALEQERAARREYVTMQEDADAVRTDALVSTLHLLTQAADSWLTTLDLLAQYRLLTLSTDEEQREAVVWAVQAQSYQQLLSVACLSVQLVREWAAGLDAPVLLLIGALPMPDKEGML